MNYQAVYQILIDHAGAQADFMEDFIYAFSPGQAYPSKEWRFIGTLGFGGKYYCQDNRVACYPEDRTPERDARIAMVNALLKQLEVSSGK